MVPGGGPPGGFFKKLRANTVKIFENIRDSFQSCFDRNFKLILGRFQNVFDSRSGKYYYAKTPHTQN